MVLDFGGAASVLSESLDSFSNRFRKGLLVELAAIGFNIRRF